MGPMPLDRAGRLRAALDRDGATCIWCGRAFAGQVTPTTEHVVPRVKGGPSWAENEDRLARSLARLAAAIARQGGQRRARPYLDAQLRRLRRREPDTRLA